jgi:DnaJ-domain-containing protein 1
MLLETILSAVITSLFWWGFNRTTTKIKVIELENEISYLRNKYSILLTDYNLLKTLIDTAARNVKQPTPSPLEQAYKTLGLTAKASLQEVKHQYRVLIKKYHPDINKSANAIAKFKKVQAAYKTITSR